ncbi:MAG: hypothetical protein LIO86_05950, partial [Lachnospiraceae bacterium]|nr:hypothetical protein [Lachnospiraceae bacterium]
YQNRALSFQLSLQNVVCDSFSILLQRRPPSLLHSYIPYYSHLETEIQQKPDDWQNIFPMIGGILIRRLANFQAAPGYYIRKRESAQLSLILWNT